MEVAIDGQSYTDGKVSLNVHNDMHHNLSL
jgi:hypothetical protein